MLLIIFSSETNPFVIDAYLMLQDIVMLIGADQPIFMTGIVEMTRTFGLELLESLLTKFPAVFEKHDQVRCWHQLESLDLKFNVVHQPSRSYEGRKEELPALCWI